MSIRRRQVFEYDISSSILGNILGSKLRDLTRSSLPDSRRRPGVEEEEESVKPRSICVLGKSLTLDGDRRYREVIQEFDSPNVHFL
jgi:hypothetical protein